MFAPPIKAPKIKIAAETGRLRLSSRRAEASTSGKSDDPQAQEGVRRPSWDFSKIPVFAPDRPTRDQTPHPFIQPKLVVGEADDPLEHEADHVADQVMGMPEPGLSVTAGPPQLSRKCADCEEEDKLRRNPSGPQAVAGKASEVVIRRCARLASRLTPRRAAISNRASGTISAACASTRTLQRRHRLAPLTFGSDIVFTAGAFSPGTSEGRKLIAHELAHTVQQGAVRAGGTSGHRAAPRTPKNCQGLTVRNRASDAAKNAGQNRSSQACYREYCGAEAHKEIGVFGRNYCRWETNLDRRVLGRL